MNAYPGWETGAGWLLNHSWQAGLLVVLVLAVQYVFRGRLTNRWRFILWWIVLGRLLLPVNPASTLSVFNYVSPPRLLAPHEAPAQYNSPAAEAVPTTASSTTPAETSSLKNEVPIPPVMPVAPASSDRPQIGSTSAGAGNAQLLPALRSKQFWYFAVAGIWLAGVLVLAGVIATQVWRFYRRLAKDARPAEERLQRLLDQCRRDFGLSRPVELLETEAVQSPALFGLFRPRLLLPRGMGNQFGERELRYIFLHELAHIQRGDLWLNWLVAGLQTVHWFNPLLWFGFARLKADRELACDELALLRAGDQAGTAYGETVVKLLEHLNRSAAIPGLIGVLEDKKQMRRRIAMIASFRKPGRWSVLALLLVLAVAAAGLTDAQSTKPAAEAGQPVAAPNLSGRPDLSGSVSLQNGEKLPVTATVFVEAAGPKTGTSTFCPYCYADCTKHVQTDSEGKFKIESLDPQLKFRLLVVAKGYQPTRVSDVDPVKGDIVKIQLKPIESAAARPDRSLRGKVVNSKGEPIADAVVNVEGIERENGGGMWGSIPGVDPLAVTDEKGEFLITSHDPFARMTVTVSARQYADQKFRSLACGDTPHTLVITEGASLKGRVMLNGRPLAGVSVGVSGVDRTSDNYVGHFEIATGPGGYFEFLNLPPDADFQIYTLMDSMNGKGAPPLRQVHTGKDGETTDAGDLNVKPGHRLAGRVVLADGQPLPAETRLLISRDAAWDSSQVTLGEDGRFEAEGIPDERVDLSVRVSGYHISGKNFSLDPLNPFRLIGRVDRDITNLVILMDKGPDLKSSWQDMGSEYEELQQHTLSGAEAKPDHSREWSVTGQVRDAETKKPIAHFTVTIGEIRYSQNTWDRTHATDGINGTYETYVNKHLPHAQLRADADGYLPAAIELSSQNASNIDFYLQKGTGPAGTVLNPDGQPASGAKIAYVGTGLNEANIDAAGELMAQADKSLMRKVDAQGLFSFPPDLGKTHLVAMSTNGFAMVSLKTFATNPVIRLEPFGRLTGTLKRTSGPGTNEVLDLALAGDNVPHLNMSYRADTDDHGRFEFDNVPATRLEVTSRISLNNDKTFVHGWQNEDLQTVDVKPGQSVEVNITAADRPTNNPTMAYTPPQAKLIPGEQIKGIVLRPNGQPAAGADVALQVQGKYLNLGKGEFVSNNLREEGLIVTTGPDGSFTLPMYDQVQSVMALNDEGFARVSVDEIKATPQVKLQKWGRIEGTVHLGRHLGTNETVSIGAAPTFLTSSPTNKSWMMQPLFYDLNAFECRSDDHGHFSFNFVPPGKQIISRQVPVGGGSTFNSQLATVEVPPGGTVVTNVGGSGRVVVGKVKVAGDNQSYFNHSRLNIVSASVTLRETLQGLKTEAERRAFLASPEGIKLRDSVHSYYCPVSADGGFRAEDVVPGDYNVSLQTFPLSFSPDGTIATFTSLHPFTVLKAKNDDDDSELNVGVIELEKKNVLARQPGGADKK